MASLNLGLGISLTPGDGGAPETDEQLIVRVALAWWSARTITTLWTDAARTVPVASDGDDIYVVDDRTGHSNLVAASGTNIADYKTNQVNGHPVIRLSPAGTSTKFTSTIAPGASSFYVMMLGKVHDTGGYPAVLCSGNGSGATYSALGGEGAKWKMRHSTEMLYESGSNYVIGDIDYVEAYFNGASSSLYITNTTTSGTAGTIAAITSLWVGVLFTNANYGEYDFTDMVILPSTVSAADRATIRTYLKTTIGGL